MAPEGQRRTSPALRVLVGDERGRRVAVPGLARWLIGVAPARIRGTVSIALVSDTRIRALNRRYRGRDYATDVLSFPATTNASRDFSSVFFVSPAVESFLGEIVIARGVARQQAREAEHSELTELRILALHGLLHLLGYDHEGDEGRMRRVERRLRHRGGLREGLIERGSADARRAAKARP